MSTSSSGASTTSSSAPTSQRRLPKLSLPGLAKLPKRTPRTKLPDGQRRVINRMMWWWLSLVVFVAAAGLVVPSIALVYAVTEGWDGSGQYTILVAAGAVQGLLLGLGQAIALRRGPMMIPFWRWVGVTTIATAVAWLVGLLPGSVFRPDWANPAVVVGMIAVILLVIAIVPGAQWTILNRFVFDAWRWIVVAAIAFGVGVGIFLCGLFVAKGNTKVVPTMLTFTFTGWMGIIAFTLITGLGMRWIAREALSPAQVKQRVPSTGKAAVVARKASSQVSAKVAPVAKKAAAGTKAAAAKVAAKAAPTVKKAGAAVRSTATRAGKATASTAKKAASRVTKKPGGKSGS